MALVVKDRVKETTTTTGTGTINLAGAVSGFQSFVSGVGDGNTTYYAITDANGAWEVGLGTVTDGSPDTLARTTVLATSNGDTSAITLSSGTHTVFGTYPAGKAVYLDASGNLSHTVALTTDTSGDYVSTITGGTGITSTGATSGEGIAHSLSVDASQTQITAVGTITTGTWQGTAIAQAYIANDAINGDKIADDAVDSEHYAAGSIDEEHLNATNTPTDNYVLSYDAVSGGFTWVAAGAGEANENSFKTISVAGQDDVVADTTTDTLTFAAGSNVTITTTAASDTVTIAATDTNTMGSGFTVSATTDTNATTITEGDDLFFAAGTGITCETTADGTVTISCTVTDTNTQLSQEQVEDYVNGLLTAGSNVSLTYDDVAGTLTIASTDTNTQLTQEQVEDYVNGLLTAGSNVSLTYDDAAGTLTVAATDTNTMGSGFVLEDGDGTEVTITENKEVKFVEGAGIDIDWTDTSDGSDADPYDLTFTVTGLTTTEIAAATLVTEADDIADNDNDTTIPTSAAVKDYADHSESILKCINASGSTLNAGECVYISGHSGTQIQVDLADSGNSAKMPAIGVVKTSAANNTAVDIVTHGKLLGLDTSTPAYSVGDELYVNSTGGFTTTPPAGESGLIQKIAKVVRVHASSGEIYIMGAGRTNAVSNLNSAKIFLGNSSNKAVAAAISGDISISNTGAVTISNDAVNADKLANTTVSAGSYTAADITVDAQGRITAAASGTIALGSEVSGTLPVANGGTGQTSYTNGQILIGNTTGNTLAKSTLTEGSNITITNGAGSITIAATDTNTQLSTEEVQDIAGPLVATGGTKTLITVTYDDVNGNMDFVVDNNLANYDNSSSGFLTAHPSIAAALSSDNSGRTYIQDITLDSNGHVTGIATATETVTDTNTMGSGFTVSATTDTTATTITEGDDLFFAAGAGITCETTADGTVTISNTVASLNGLTDVTVVGTNNLFIETDGAAPVNAITTGVSNIAIGNNSLSTNDSGHYNIAIGENTLKAQGSGSSRSIAIGTDAMRYASANQCVAIGHEALEGDPSFNSFSQYNTAIGYQTLKDITTGDNNVALGYLAGTDITSASDCIFIGSYAGYTHTTGDSILYIGSNTEANDGTIIKADMAEKHLAIGMADDHFSNSAGDATLQVYPKDAADKGIYVKLQATPSANSLEIDASDGSNLFVVSQAGAVTTGTWEATDVAVAHGGTGASNASDARTNLGVAIGSDVQAYDAALAAIAGLATTDGGVIVGNGSTFVLETGATLRTSLGVDPAGTDNSTNVTLVTTSHDYLSITNQAITLGQIDIGDDTNLTAGTNITLSGDTLNVDDAFLINNGDDTTSGTVTMANLIVGDAGNIGSASDTDAIAIASDGEVTLSQRTTFSKAVKTPLKSNTDGVTITFDLDEASTHTVTLGDNRTLAISNEDAGQKFIINLVQDATGSRTVTWFSTIKWAGGSAPTLTTTANKADSFGFLCTGTDAYYGFVIGQNI